jgi:simple sugar transport system ATP-binding protein
MEEILRVEGLDKHFGRIHAVNDVSFKLNESEVIGLVGDNGAGKSTVVKMLSGLYRPDHGRVFFKGQEVAFSSPNDARNLGIETIYQDQALVPSLNIYRNIFLGRELTRRIGFVNILDHKRMNDLSLKILQDVGLNIQSSEIPITSLSGGERQGVAIARAMFYKASLLLLDEPTAALSLKETQEVLNFISQLKEQGITSVFITHNLHHVWSVADRFIVLSHGRKVGDVKKNEITMEDLEKLIVTGLSDQILRNTSYDHRHESMLL